MLQDTCFCQWGRRQRSVQERVRGAWRAHVQMVDGVITHRLRDGAIVRGHPMASSAESSRALESRCWFRPLPIAAQTSHAPPTCSPALMVTRPPACLLTRSPALCFQQCLDVWGMKEKWAHGDKHQCNTWMHRPTTNKRHQHHKVHCHL